MNFDYYQRRAQVTDKTEDVQQTTLGLAEKVGLFAAELKHHIRYGTPISAEAMSMRAGDILWYLAASCSKLGIDLDEAAARNLTWTEERWGGPDKAHPILFSRLFDDEFPQNEQLPRQFTVRFEETESPKLSDVPWVKVWFNDKPFGDPINDNTSVPDDYRLHDILHFAFAGILGWSPIVRKLQRYKRKSNPRVDENEDGARATDFEEALSNRIHNEAKRDGFFQGFSTLPTPFLIDLKFLASSLEISARTAFEWQNCILEAYRIFRLLRARRGKRILGVVHVSLLDRSLTFAVPD